MFEREWGTAIPVVLVGFPQRPLYQLQVIDANGNWTRSSKWDTTPSGGDSAAGSRRA